MKGYYGIISLTLLIAASIVRSFSPGVTISRRYGVMHADYVNIQTSSSISRILHETFSRRTRRTYLLSTTKAEEQRAASSTRVPENIDAYEKFSKKNKIQTPQPKYPTKRGSEVDSRKIIAHRFGKNSDVEYDTNSPIQTITAIRLKHILFATSSLASQTLNTLRSSKILFDDLANQISLCAETRDDGGEIGWMNVSPVPELSEIDKNGEKVEEEQDLMSDNINEHLDLILPPRARMDILSMSTKPGDVVMVSSERGYHLVQIVDLMVDVRQIAQRKLRRENLNAYLQQRYADTNKVSDANAKEQHQLLNKPWSGKGLTYKMETMGCQMNLADSERIEGQLQNLGIFPIKEEEVTTKKSKKKKIYPDIIIFNTCSIRDHAEQKVYSHIGPYAKRKRDGKDMTIIVAGCVAQQEGESLLRRAPEVDLVMGPQYANRIGDLLEDVHNGNQVVATEASHIMEDSTKPRRQSSIAAWVSVIYGCNERCSFCIVPSTRGVEQSRPMESIVKEVEDLVNEGYKEVTLLGQNIDAYGRDMLPKRKFSDLLGAVGSIPGLQRLRFVTSHPRYMSLGVIDAVAETPAACLNFNIPFQSGSNEVLLAMGRGHTREAYLKIVERIRQRAPDASITADAIVGFPGETEEQFEDTLKLMKEVKFDSVNTRAYSPRPNTPAADWDNQLSEEVKEDRLRRINELNKQHSKERRARMLGRIEEVLVETRNVKRPTQVMGRTTHGYIVFLDGNIDELKGELVQVKIDSCSTFHLTGTIVG